MKYVIKYYKLIIIVVVLAIAGIYLLNRTTIEIGGYNADNAYDTIKELSSEKYLGRQYGTPQNMEAVNYIEKQFKSIGLDPDGDDGTYFKSYSESTRVYNGEAVLELLDREGRPVKKFEYGKDFIEQSYGYSMPGELTADYDTVKYIDLVMAKTGEKAGRIAITTPESRDLMTLKDLATVTNKAGYGALITVVGNDADFIRQSPDIGNRPPYLTGYELPTLIIKESAAKELMDYKDKGLKLHVKSTFDIKTGSVVDVVGKIPGKEKGYLFITCHLDGVGTTSDGTVYPGALDDASGTGAMLELARYIKSQGRTPLKTIVFIAFNGEEGGMLGSERLVHRSDYPYYEASMLNLDMVGAKGDIPLTFMYSSVYSSWVDKTVDFSSKMRYHLKGLAGKMGISVKEVDQKASDHVYFSSSGVPAITLIDYDDSKIHTPADNMDNVDVKNIDRALKLAMGYISMTAYSNFSAYGYSMVLEDILGYVRAQYPIILGLLLVGALSILYYRKRKAHPELGSRNFPVLTAVFMMLLICAISYFPLEFLSAPVDSASAAPGLLLQGILSILKSLIMLPMYAILLIPSIFILYMANRRMKSVKYEGNGKEYDFYFYGALVLFIVISLGIAAFFSQPIHLIFTPEFAKYCMGRLIMYAVIGGLAYLVGKLLSMEVHVRPKSFGSFIAFSIIFFMLLSAFYMPIATNKFVMSINYRGVTINDYSAFD